MNKRKFSYIFLLTSLILLVVVSLFLGNYHKQKESFSSLCVSEDFFNDIVSKREESKKPLIKELMFDGNTLFFDEEDNHFYYSLVKDSSTAYNPSIEWNGTRYDIVIKQTNITDESIHQNEEIEVLIYNKNKYSIAKLTCTTLPIMNCNVNVAMEEIDDSYQDMRMILFDNEKNVTTDLIGEIHTRGAFVMHYPKKSFRIKLKQEKGKEVQPISIMGFKEGREYILYPGYNDQERVRNVFSTNLWYESCAKNNVFGLNNGEYYKYYEMFINGKYWGLYAITYPIDETVLNIITDQKSPNFLKENLYKKTNGATNEYKIDWDTYPIKFYDLKTNVDYADKEEGWLPLKNYYKTLFNAKNPKEIYEIVDINNSIDIFLFYNLIQGIDNVSIWKNDDNMLHNTYLFSKVYNDNYKMLYCPWDMDRTWGNGEDFEPYDVGISYNSIMYLNPVFYLLDLGDENIKDLIKQRYEYLRDCEWSEDFLANMLKEYEKDIFYSGAYCRDVTRWPTSAKIENDEHLSVFINYVLNRLIYMDQYIESFLDD